MSNGKGRSATDPIDRFKAVTDSLGPVRMTPDEPMATAFVTDTARIALAGRVIEALDRRRLRERPVSVRHAAASDTKKT